MIVEIFCCNLTNKYDKYHDKFHNDFCHETQLN